MNDDGDGDVNQSDKCFEGMRTSVAAAIAERRGDVIPSGLAVLDAILGGGVHRKQLTVLAGAPGVGTSMLGLNIARHAAINYSVQTLIVAPDADQSELLIRLASAETKIPVSHLRSGHLTDVEIARLAQVQSRLGAAPLILSTNWLRSEQPVDKAIDDYAKDGELGLVIVDFPPDSRRIVRALKMAAQEHNLAVVVCSKTPTRSPGSATLGPTLYEIADAGVGLDELSDVVLGLHRPDMHDEASVRPGEADITVLKHRYGPTRTLPAVAFQGHYARFVDLVI